MDKSRARATKANTVIGWAAQMGPRRPRPPSDRVKRQNPIGQRSFVYLLEQENTGHTYVGFTVNPKRRQRQHNGEIKGGARATAGKRSQGKWKIVFLVTADPKWFQQVAAQQLEYAWKHPGKRAGKEDDTKSITPKAFGGILSRRRPLRRRLCVLATLFQSSRKWTKSAPAQPEPGQVAMECFSDPTLMKECPGMTKVFSACQGWKVALSDLDLDRWGEEG